MQNLSSCYRLWAELFHVDNTYLRPKIFGKIEKSENSKIQQGNIVEARRGFGNDFGAEESFPLQVSGAVTRLTVYRAAPHFK